MRARSPAGTASWTRPRSSASTSGAWCLALDAADAERLPKPSANPATMSASPDDTAEGELERKLRRAWDLISGRY